MSSQNAEPARPDRDHARSLQDAIRRGVVLEQPGNVRLNLTLGKSPFVNPDGLAARNLETFEDADRFADVEGVVMQSRLGETMRMSQAGVPSNASMSHSRSPSMRAGNSFSVREDAPLNQSRRAEREQEVEEEKEHEEEVEEEEDKFSTSRCEEPSHINDSKMMFDQLATKFNMPTKYQNMYRENGFYSTCEGLGGNECGISYDRNIVNMSLNTKYDEETAKRSAKKIEEYLREKGIPINRDNVPGEPLDRKSLSVLDDRKSVTGKSIRDKDISLSRDIVNEASNSDSCDEITPCRDVSVRPAADISTRRSNNTSFRSVPAADTTSSNNNNNNNNTTNTNNNKSRNTSRAYASMSRHSFDSYQSHDESEENSANNSSYEERKSALGKSSVENNFAYCPACGTDISKESSRASRESADDSNEIRFDPAPAELFKPIIEDLSEGDSDDKNETEEDYKAKAMAATLREMSQGRSALMSYSRVGASAVGSGRDLTGSSMEENGDNNDDDLNTSARERNNSRIPQNVASGLFHDYATRSFTASKLGNGAASDNNNNNNNNEKKPGYTSSSSKIALGALQTGTNLLSPYRPSETRLLTEPAELKALRSNGKLDINSALTFAETLRADIGASGGKQADLTRRAGSLVSSSVVLGASKAEEAEREETCLSTADLNVCERPLEEVWEAITEEAEREENIALSQIVDQYNLRKSNRLRSSKVCASGCE